MEYDNLINVKKFDSETMNLEECINKETKFVTKCIAEPAIKNL